MAKRRDNMLEAFKASSATKSEADGSSIEPSIERGSGGPFGTPLGGASPARSPAPPGSGMTLPVGPGAFLVLQLALLVLAFLAGQASGGFGTVQAQGPEDGDALSSLGADGNPVAPNDSGLDSTRAAGPDSNLGVSGQPQPNNDGVFSIPPDGGGRGARRPGTGSALSSKSGGESADTASGTLSLADQAFADPANRFTVHAFTADDTEFGRERAGVSLANLTAQGFAAVSPRQRGGKVLLYVGAFQSFAQADKARSRVANAPGPDGRQTPYSGAFVVNIPR